MMTGPGLLWLLTASGLAAGIVLAVLWAIGKVRLIQTPAVESRGSGEARASLLFRNGGLINANAAAVEWLAGAGENSYDWAELVSDLEPAFPDMPASHTAAEALETTVLRAGAAAGGFDTLRIERWDDMARVSITRKSGTDRDRDQSDTNCGAIINAPYPIWRTDEDGAVTWSNCAYDALARTLGRKEEPLFECAPTEEGSRSRRTGLTDASHDKTYWFDVTSVPTKRGRMHYATDANAIVNAEIAQRNFVQTLTKTFAQLSIGLAIFDRNRQLALFNPSLIDLTALPADFLSARPSLMSFFDRLRENRVMPEPKNYASWRAQIAELVVAASDGRYSETWSLPSGLTYRVTGRPHPDGAIAFLFEDISAEISLTRRFRTDLELGQSVLDALDSAIVVFSSTGSLSLCNGPYRRLWQSDPDHSFAEYTLRDALPLWKSRTAPSPVWDRLRRTVLSTAERHAWQDKVTLTNGSDLHLFVTPVDRGSTLVKFQSLTEKGTLAPIPVLADPVD